MPEHGLETINPYAAPNVDVEAKRSDRLEAHGAETSLLKLALRWTLICTVGAGPSFFFGYGLCRSPWDAMGMVIGIAMFIVLYTSLTASSGWRNLPTPYRHWIYAAFWTRVGISIVFPLGMGNDMLCGILSLQLITVMFSIQGDPFGPDMMTFGQVVLTTVVQGILLNIEIWAFALLLLGVRRVWFNVYPRRYDSPNRF